MQRMDELLNRVGGLEDRLPPAQQPGVFDPLDPYGQGQVDPALLQGLYGPDPNAPQPGQQPVQGQQQMQQPGADPQTGFAYGQQQAVPGYPQQQPGIPGQQQLPPELGGQPQPGVDPQGLTAMLAEPMQQAVQQAVAPLAQQVMRDRMEREAEGFLQDYPQYNDDTQAQQLRQNVQEWAGQFDPSLAPAVRALASSPTFLELVHLASQTEARAQGEIPAGGGNQQPAQQQQPAVPGQQPQQQPAPVPIERPGGAPPGVVDPNAQPKLSDQIKAAATGHPFFTGTGPV